MNENSVSLLCDDLIKIYREGSSESAIRFTSVVNSAFSQYYESAQYIYGDTAIIDATPPANKRASMISYLLKVSNSYRTLDQREWGPVKPSDVVRGYSEGSDTIFTNILFAPLPGLKRAGLAITYSIMRESTHRAGVLATAEFDYHGLDGYRRTPAGIMVLPELALEKADSNSPYIEIPVLDTWVSNPMLRIATSGSRSYLYPEFNLEQIDIGSSRFGVMDPKQLWDRGLSMPAPQDSLKCQVWVDSYGVEHQIASGFNRPAFSDIKWGIGDRDAISKAAIMVAALIKFKSL